MNHHDPIPLEAYEKRSQQPRAKAVRLTAAPYVWRDPASIPPRQWLYGNHYIRSYVTATVAPGGLGKTSVVQTEALAMATGRNLLGVEPSCDLLRVWLWNLEDPVEEVERRFAAAVLQHGVNPGEFKDKIFLNSGRDTRLVIASKVKDSITIAEPVIDALVAEIQAKEIDVLIIDPFVSSHGLPENDNAAVDAAVKAWGRVAGKTNCSIELVHHSRKLNGDQISADSARGGSAFVDGCRAVRVINRMTEDEAAKFGLDEHRRYIFMMPDKQNMAPPVDKRDWFQMVSVPLPNGDNVAAVESWTPPNPFDDVTVQHLEQAQNEFDLGNYRESDQSPEWGGFVVARLLDINAGDGLKGKECSSAQKKARAKVRSILRTWQMNGAIALETRLDTNRHERKFYVSVRD
ncbi:AAA family ATPase [Rhizobium rhizogenes]|uniref:AAA family ATPase n=1 Tax=Rhizobium rhizogenes TaxID=359 RepID=UPI00157179C8|nr:AAA family ATPase [Rhizobium rhizogenes]NTI22272.1 AAA family ATPase [Rhizobium rhizogenes]QTG05864.1 AAA family ATPase [Rhizobium rhizogenes]